MKPAHTSQKIQAPKSWAELPWGSYYRDALERAMHPWWSKFFGFHLLKIGCLSAEIISEQCAIAHQVNVGKEGNNMQVMANPYQLPFSAKSIDACFLAHELAYSIDPHGILREVDRVLIDDGWMVVTNFNPVSLVGLGKLLPVIRHRQPHISRMFTQIRLLDWLSVLNYEVMYQSCFQVLPWHKYGGRFLSAHLPSLGCLSLIIARKRTLPLTCYGQIRMRNPLLNRAVGVVSNCQRSGLSHESEL